jgi:hypothetical protein
MMWLSVCCPITNEPVTPTTAAVWSVGPPSHIHTHMHDQPHECMLLRR